jgi:hypothetical protein
MCFSGIGDQSCFFKTNWGKMVYFHAPVSVLLGRLATNKN